MVQSAYSRGAATQSYPGSTPIPPTPPVTPAVALPAGAPTLGLSLASVIIIVNGSVSITSSFPGATVQRR